MTNLNKYFKSAEDNGFIEIAPGVYLSSKDYITAEQNEQLSLIGQDDEVEVKVYKFASAPFWLTTNDCQDPMAVYNIADIKDIVEVK